MLAVGADILMPLSTQKAMGYAADEQSVRPAGTLVAQLSPHWGNILRVFDRLLETLKRNNVPPFLVKKLFQQLFSFVNVQLFNQLLLRRECCSFSNGEYVKTGLAEVENWIHGAGKEWVGESWDELRYIRQVRLVPFAAIDLLLWRTDSLAMLTFGAHSMGPSIPAIGDSSCQA